MKKKCDISIDLSCRGKTKTYGAGNTSGIAALSVGKSCACTSRIEARC